MKRLIVWVLLCASIAGAKGAEPSPRLVQEVIQAMNYQEGFDALMAHSLAEYSRDAKPEQRARLAKYFESMMGWNVIKDDVARIVSTTYTEDELRAQLAFFKKPVGASIAKKNAKFQIEITDAMAKRGQAAQTDLASSVADTGDENADAGAEATGLHTRDVEEHATTDGVYFTGAIENTGKKNIRGVEVEINLFQGGRFVDQYSTYMTGIVAKGTTRLFKVNCGCKSSLPAKHDSFQVRVNTSGY